MIKFFNGCSFDTQPELRLNMHQDRAYQFKHRLKWDVTVKSDGGEYDEYDARDTVYVIATDKDNNHNGSMRLTPTVGRTMVNDYFSDLCDGRQIRSPIVWESTRFCLSPCATASTAALLLAAGAKFMFENNIKHYVGVFDARMLKVYARLGSSPTIVGESKKTGIAVGLWAFDLSAYHQLCRKGNIDPIELDRLYDVSEFGTTSQVLPALIPRPELMNAVHA